jgi:hypothetical protein
MKILYVVEVQSTQFDNDEEAARRWLERMLVGHTRFSVQVLNASFVPEEKGGKDGSC